jgi:hypothetical protein
MMDTENPGRRLRQSGPGKIVIPMINKASTIQGWKIAAIRSVFRPPPFTAGPGIE